MLVPGTRLEIGMLKRGHWYITWRHHQLERNWDWWYHVGMTTYQKLVADNERLKDQLMKAYTTIDAYEEKYGYDIYDEIDLRDDHDD